MRSKGRIAVGADADLTVFDANRVIDRATYEQPMEPSEGIAHVLVNGTFVVRDGVFIAGALPGRAIRFGE
jgi:N-acyl-D-aspartate/D-glutamate deacylase